MIRLGEVLGPHKVTALSLIIAFTFIDLVNERTLARMQWHSKGNNHKAG